MRIEVEGVTTGLNRLGWGAMKAYVGTWTWVTWRGDRGGGRERGLGGGGEMGGE